MKKSFENQRKIPFSCLGVMMSTETGNDIYNDRVVELMQQVQSGVYKVDARQVAAKIIEEILTTKTHLDFL